MHDELLIFRKTRRKILKLQFGCIEQNRIIKLNFN